MKGRSDTRREQSPIHNGTHTSEVGMNKAALYASMAMAAIGTSCTPMPHYPLSSQFHPIPRAIQMSPTTL